MSFDAEQMLEDAVLDGDLELLRSLLESDDVPIPTAFMEFVLNAVEDNQLEVIELLMDYGLDPSGDENVLLRNAVSSGHFDMVQLLLSDPRVDPSACDAYNLAVDFGYEDIAELLQA